MAERVHPDYRELEEFKLTGVEVVREANSEPKVLGYGCYADVIELNYHGLKCAGKKFYKVLESEHTTQQIIKECKTLAKMRHPCIVQFLGVYWLQSSTLPVLVMECLYTTLGKCIAKHSNLPDEISYTILADVINALCYLHSKQIAHRDLSSNNILLTPDMRAKISDLGMAKILSEELKSKLTKQPGTLDFMPPEAIREDPKYSIEIDIFAYGVIMLLIFCGEYPAPISKGEDAVSRTEVERRKKYIDKLPPSHPMLEPIKKCLGEPETRPKASEIQAQIGHEKDRLAILHCDKMMMVKHRESLEKRVNDCETIQITAASKMSDLETKVGELEATVESYQSSHDIANLRADNEKLQIDLENTRRQLKTKEDQLLKQGTQTHAQIHTLKQQRNQAMAHLTSGKQFHMLHSQVKLRQDKIMEPAGTSRPQPVELSAPMTAAQCTLIKSTLYFGGGETGGSIEEKSQILTFNCDDNTLDRLPQCPVIHFGLGNIGGKLVTVGGKSSADGTTLSNKACVYLEGTREWKESGQPESVIPSLSVPRARACVISQTEDESSSCIAVCGGKVLGGVNTSLVEVYSKHSPQWVQVRPLPHARAALRATVLHNTAYLLGGYEDLGEKSKPDCYSIALSNLFGKDQPIVWSSLADLPTQSATPAHLCGTLLAIGGSIADGKPVHAYSLIRRQWVHIADLTVGISHATAAALPNGKVLIIGGRDIGGNRNKNMFIVEVTGQMF